MHSGRRTGGGRNRIREASWKQRLMALARYTIVFVFLSGIQGKEGSVAYMKISVSSPVAATFKKTHMDIMFPWAQNNNKNLLLPF